MDPFGIVPGEQMDNYFNLENHYNDGLNMYEYVISNPLIAGDPMGLDFDPSGLAKCSQACTDAIVVVEISAVACELCCELAASGGGKLNDTPEFKKCEPKTPEEWGKLCAAVGGVIDSKIPHVGKIKNIIKIIENVGGCKILKPFLVLFAILIGCKSFLITRKFLVRGNVY